MPEGDTIFKLAAYLQPALQGRDIAQGFALAQTRVDLGGRRIGDVYARGKHLFIELDADRVLRSHLGMWGSWHAYAPDEPWKRPHERASILIDIGSRIFVCFQAKEVEWQHRRGVSQRRLKQQLGPDLLNPGVSFDTILQRARALSSKQRPICDVLLDQKIACGIGNVYKSETLFVSRRHPSTPLAQFDDADLKRLFSEARTLLASNTRGGPRVTRRAHDEAARLWVYGRTAQPCLICDTPIEGKMLGEHQRSTFWCPNCQPV
jgi:endonuclease-8